MDKEIMFNIIKSELIREVYIQGQDNKIKNFDEFTKDYIKNAQEVYDQTGCHLPTDDYVANFQVEFNKK